MYIHIFTKKLYNFNYKQVQKIKNVSLKCLKKINILKIKLINLKKNKKYIQKYKKKFIKKKKKCIKKLKSNIKNKILKKKIMNEISLKKEKIFILKKCFIIIKMLLNKKVTFKNGLDLINNLIKSCKEKNYLLNLKNNNKILFFKLQNENKINNFILKMRFNYIKKILKKKKLKKLKKKKKKNKKKKLKKIKN
jgi:hypothetical protein